MSSEKLQILKMLEEHKITADEAARLLQSLGSDSPRTGEYSQSTGKDSGVRSESEYRREGSQYRQYSSPSSTSFDDFAGDLGRKFETLARDMEPKIQKFAGVVVEKTAIVADKISKNLSEAHESYRANEANRDSVRAAAPQAPRAEAPRPAAPRPTPPRTTPSYSQSGFQERSFELRVESGYNELNLAGLNGDVVVKGYNGDKITVRVFVKEHRPGARIELMRLGSKYYLSYDEDDFKAVSVDALVPETMFDNARISGTGGRLEVSNLKLRYFVAEGSNGASVFKNISAENISIDTSNGRITLSGLRSKNAVIESSNGGVEADGIDVAGMRLTHSNGPITMNIANFNDYDDYIWVVETSNGKVSLNVPSSPAIGYHLKGHTSLGSLKVGLVGLNYIANDISNVEAKSISYDTAQKHIKISAETSNAPLNIS